jgi:hypothetical protein
MKNSKGTIENPGLTPPGAFADGAPRAYRTVTADDGDPNTTEITQVIDLTSWPYASGNKIVLLISAAAPGVVAHLWAKEETGTPPACYFVKSASATTKGKQIVIFDGLPAMKYVVQFTAVVNPTAIQVFATN